MSLQKKSPKPMTNASTKTPIAPPISHPSSSSGFIEESGKVISTKDLATMAQDGSLYSPVKEGDKKHKEMMKKLQKEKNSYTSHAGGWKHYRNRRRSRRHRTNKHKRQSRRGHKSRRGRNSRRKR